MDHGSAAEMSNRNGSLWRGRRLMAGLLLLCCAMAVYAQVGRLGLPVKPGVDLVKPDHIIQGRSATLLLHGTGLRAGIQVELGADVKAGALSMVNDTTARVSVSVAPQAVPGSRPMTLIADGVHHTQKVKVTIDANTQPLSIVPMTTTTPSPPPQKGTVLTAQTDKKNAANQGASKLRLLQVAPDKLQTGQIYTLQLKGIGFAAGMSADFGAGIQLRGPLVVQNTTSASARIRVAPSAVPGFRNIKITLTSAPSNSGMVALPGTTQESMVPHGLEILGQTKGIVLQQSTPEAPPPPAAGGFAPPPTAPAPTTQIASAVAPVAPPVIQSVSPDTVIAGKTVKLSLKGVNLSGDLKIDFGPGILPQGKILLSDPTTAQLTIAVAAGAPPLLRKLKIVSPLTGQGAPQPATLKVKGPLLKLKLPSAKPKPQLVPFITTGLMQGKIDLKTPSWTVKSLDEYSKQEVKDKGDFPNKLIHWDIEDIPTLNDQTLFSWHEQNPGLAEWYEIRFFVGGKLVKSQRIDPVTLIPGSKLLAPFFRPSGAFVAELMAFLPTVAQIPDPDTINAAYEKIPQGNLLAQKNDQSGESKANKPSLTPSIDKALAKANITWEVAGFRTYMSNGVTKSAALSSDSMLAANQNGGFAQPLTGGFAPPQTGGDSNPNQPTSMTAGSVPIPKTVQVEISERWPLFKPNHPTGLGCGIERGHMDLTNIDVTSEASKDNKGKKSKGSESVSMETANHTGETFELTGKFDLALSPYASKPQSANFFGLVTSWQYDNLFIDWGDGTVEPLKFNQKGTVNYTQDAVIDLAKSTLKYHHAYDEIGEYTVRLYQLSGDDIQNGQAQGVAHSENPPDTLYYAALGQGGGHAKQQLSLAKPIADRAYMLSCQHIRIQARTDPLANGPLHLEAIDIQGFPFDDSEKAANGRKENLRGIASQSKAGEAGKTTGTAKFTGGAQQSTSKTRAISGEGTKVPAFTACDMVVNAGARVKFFGEGKARLRWLLDGKPFNEQEWDLGPSTSRDDKTLASNRSKKPIIDTAAPLTSPDLPLDKIGQHKVQVEAEVVPSPKRSDLYRSFSQALGAGGGKRDEAVARGLAKGLKGGPKVGVLSPYKVSIPGMPSVSYLNRPLEHIAQRTEPLRLALLTPATGNLVLNDAVGDLAGRGMPKKGPPNYVSSETRSFKVTGYDETQPCSFKFPVDGGEFIVAGLQDASGTPKVTHEGDLFSGQGTLQVKLPNENGEITSWPVPLDFKDWKVDNDGVTVLSGSLNLHPDLPELGAPALKLVLKQLQGKTGDHIDATLDARLANKNLRDVNNTVPSWQGLTATLSPQGDWYSDGAPFPKLLVYDSGTYLTSDQVALDLSATQGSDANTACYGGGQGKGWMGVKLSDQTQFYIYDFDLIGEPHVTLADWGIDNTGLCGKTTSGSFSKDWLRGEVKWDSIDISAENGGFKSVYNNLRIKVPWLETEVKSSSSQALTAGKNAGKGSIELSLHGESEPLKEGPITLTAKDLMFMTEKGVGPVVKSKTQFDFQNENKSFAKGVVVNDLLFGLDGKAYFEAGGGSRTVNIGGKSGHIAGGVANHKSVTVTALADTTGRLAFDFSSDLKISDTLPTAPVTISYQIDEPATDNYQGSGPKTAPFKLTKPFPDANPTTVVEISPTYAGSQEQVAASDPPPPLSWVSPAYAASSGIRFYGDTSSFMFGSGAPVSGKFLLGYVGDDDYWMAKAKVNLGPSGIVLVPPFLNLYEISGGLGYNVSLNSFKNQDLTQATPKVDGVQLFNAGMLVGSPDGFAYGLRGNFSIKLSGPDAGARMDYDAWLASSQRNGAGNFTGYFQYAGGAFDGTMNGEYSMLNDMAYVKAENDAVALHFGDDKWFINAGSKQKPVKGHVLILDANAYLSIGSDGLNVGASNHKKLQAGNCSGACAYVEGNAAIDAKITPQPHIAASAKQGFSAGACAWVGCLSGGVTTSMKAAALPPYLKYGYGFSACPIGKINIGLTILPSPSPGVSAEGCDLGDIF